MISILKRPAYIEIACNQWYWCMPARQIELTPEQQAVTDRLKALWDALRGKPLPDGSKLTQERAAELMDCTQPSVNQWLKGKTVVGPLAVLRFSRILQVSPTDIDPEWLLTDEILIALNADDREMMRLFLQLPVQTRAHVAGIVKTLAQQQEESND